MVSYEQENIMQMKLVSWDKPTTQFNIIMWRSLLLSQPSMQRTCIDGIGRAFIAYTNRIHIVLGMEA